ncbi:MAG: hypothetical protein PHT99_11115 [Methanoregula sp.]|nr:hypothetical protein [Methanoregula sp.]
MSATHGIVLICLIFVILCPGCTMTGDNAGTTPAATPSPTGTSYVIVETEPETPLPTTPVVNVTEISMNTSVATKPPSAETLETGTNKQAYPYVIRSMSQFLYFNTYEGVLDYLQDKYPARPKDFFSSAPSENDYRQYISDPVQKSCIDGFVENIRDRSDLPQERVRIAVSLVQHIPYNTSSGNLYPYEVLYYNAGRSGDKSILAAYLISEMGYGTALFVYIPERHVALGLKCPKQYSTGGSGYCFVETTYPAIMTYSNGTYAGVGKLTSSPVIIPIADGESFDQIAEEYVDAASYQATLNSAVANTTGTYMDTINYDIYGDLRQKYGLFDLDLVNVR